MKLKFKKMKQSRSFQQVADQIQAAIIDGSLKAGDKLPAEMKLKDMFNTSRGTIREALRVLEQKGLIDIKTGVSGGAIIREVDTQIITEGLDILIQHRKVTLDHISEFRHEVEGTVASLAAERASDKDIQRLKKLLGKAHEQLKKGVSGKENFFRTDVELHIKLAEIARNPIFVAVLQMVHENILGRWLKFSPDDENILKENYEDLRGIVEAVGNGESNKARLLANDHISRFNRYMEMERQKSK